MKLFCSANDPGMHRPQSPERHRRAGSGAATLAEADALLNSPTLDMSQAARALSLYEGALSAGGAPRASVLAHLSRTCFVLGQLAPKQQSMGYYRQGQSYAETLIREEPNRVEGHYWLALNLCGQADVGGKLLGRRLLPRILEELQRAVALDETYDQAGAHRVLGRIYYEAPGWPLSVGDLKNPWQHLKAAVRLAPDNSTNHLYLAQTLLRLQDNPAARAGTGTGAQIHPLCRETPGPGGGPAGGPAAAGGNQGRGRPVSGRNVPTGRLPSRSSGVTPARKQQVSQVSRWCRRG